MAQRVERCLAVAKISINLNEARAVAADYLQEGVMRREGFAPIIIDDATEETTFGWVFFYDSEEYLCSGNFAHAIAGNAPIVVLKADGTISQTGTARSLSDYLAEIQRQQETQ
jgi:hypothetical protein